MSDQPKTNTNNQNTKELNVKKKKRNYQRKPKSVNSKKLKDETTKNFMVTFSKENDESYFEQNLTDFKKKGSSLDFDKGKNIKERPKQKQKQKQKQSKQMDHEKSTEKSFSSEFEGLLLKSQKEESNETFSSSKSQSSFNKFNLDAQCFQETVPFSLSTIDWNSLGFRGQALTKTKEFAEGNAICAICFQKIHPIRDGKLVKFWNCQRCNVILHFSCATRALATFPAKCPHCRHVVDPPLFRCFGGHSINPQLTNGISPGCCSAQCGKELPCGHKCFLPCHAGQCSTCNLTSTHKCYCGKQEMTIPCALLNDEGVRSCGNICGKLLDCGRHYCQRICHSSVCVSKKPLAKICSGCGIYQNSSGLCEFCGFDNNSDIKPEIEFQQKMALQEIPSKYVRSEFWHPGSVLDKNLKKLSNCEALVKVSCFCGKTVSTVECGNVPLHLRPNNDGIIEKICSCDQVCDKLLDCGECRCVFACHEGPCKRCDRNPRTRKTCACGKTQMHQHGRFSCSDPLLTCDKICGKPLSAYPGHVCNQPCHDGPCPITKEIIQVPCRCGSQIIKISSLDLANGVEPSCQTVCGRLLNCGKHICRKKCCPLRSIPNSHFCEKKCGQSLSCGHTCQEACGHPGPCPPCGYMILEPITCPCGKTLLNPPQPCGTTVPCCKNICEKILKCGHKCKTRCHEGNCPSCTELVVKPCACGKEMKEQQCGGESARCKNICEKILCCGHHVCHRRCHPPDEYCSDDRSKIRSCHRECGKKLECGHICKTMCHPNDPCPACSFVGIRTCSCGFNTVSGLCDGTMIKCDEECVKHQQKKQRLKNMMEIGGLTLINQNFFKHSTEFDPELIQLARSNPSIIEKLDTLLIKLIFHDKSDVYLEFTNNNEKELIETYIPLWGPIHCSFHTKNQQFECHLALKNGYLESELKQPLPLLSKLIEVPLIEKMENVRFDRSLILFDLPVSYTTTDVIEYLLPLSMSYSLKWLNDNEIILMFTDRNSALDAFEDLHSMVFPVRKHPKFNRKKNKRWSVENNDDGQSKFEKFKPSLNAWKPDIEAVNAQLKSMKEEKMKSKNEEKDSLKEKNMFDGLM
eukprot:TRINITY_DN2973_c0_g3_i1.p1 TRINITY_DN2973_c0_g3~~TRINITY_DN2973_c0_g3_i1.p1  ORF type:complete len:1084 (-),score=270.04 TRINITY_DN2973_c0_g3_i1:694-3945(-)